MLKDWMIFIGLMVLSAMLALLLTGCTRKSINSSMICKYQDIDCDNVVGYKDQKACYINSQIKKEFCGGV